MTPIYNDNLIFDKVSVEQIDNGTKFDGLMYMVDSSSTTAMIGNMELVFDNDGNLVNVNQILSYYDLVTLKVSEQIVIVEVTFEHNILDFSFDTTGYTEAHSA